MANKTPVTILQEFMVQRHTIPNYVLIHVEIGQDPLFKYSVCGMGKMAIGSGKSKKEAKHDAARMLLQMLKEDKENPEFEKSALLKEVDVCFSPYDNTVKDNAVGDLQLFCGLYYLMNPKYDLILDVGPPHSKRFTIRCSISSLKFEATARTKKQAKHRSSAGMLDKLKILLNEFLDSSDRQELIENQIVICDLARETTCFRYPLSDLCSVFTSPNFNESPKLNDVRVSYENIYDVPQPLETLKIICEELKYKLDISELPSTQSEIVCVNITLVSKPGWSFIGYGNDYNDAVTNSVYKAFQFLLDMIPKQ